MGSWRPITRRLTGFVPLSLKRYTDASPSLSPRGKGKKGAFYDLQNKKSTHHRQVLSASSVFVQHLYTIRLFFPIFLLCLYEPTTNYILIRQWNRSMYKVNAYNIILFIYITYFFFVLIGLTMFFKNNTKRKQTKIKLKALRFQTIKINECFFFNAWVRRFVKVL